MANYFLNPDDGRLRAGWRILAFMALLVGLSVVGQTMLKALLGGIPKVPFLREAAVISLAAVASTIAVPLARRWLDRKTFASLGLVVDGRTLKDILFGFVLSGWMAGTVFAVMWATGLISVTGVAWNGDPSSASGVGSMATYMAQVSVGSLALMLLLTVVISWWEELVFRGYLLQNLMEGIGRTPAIIASCVFFGLVHALNPNAGVLSTLIIMLFGFLRIYGYIATRQLWLTIGMHIGWNFFQGPVFGYAASGHVSASLVQQTATGPGWLSGGAFGPEGSLLVIPVMALALVVMRWWGRHGDQARITRSFGPACRVHRHS